MKFKNILISLIVFVTTSSLFAGVATYGSVGNIQESVVISDIVHVEKNVAGKLILVYFDDNNVMKKMTLPVSDSQSSSCEKYALLVSQSNLKFVYTVLKNSTGSWVNASCGVSKLNLQKLKILGKQHNN